jgi:iron-sulfur cluster repair protein YtfE (RIC family)
MSPSEKVQAIKNIISGMQISMQEIKKTNYLSVSSKISKLRAEHDMPSDILLELRKLADDLLKR